MFTYLYESILPLVGDFIGILVSIAETTPTWWLDNIELVMEGVNDTIMLTYNNYFTAYGFADLEVNALFIPANIFDWAIIGSIAFNLINGFFSVFFFTTVDIPLWIALPTALAIWSIALIAVKWFFSIVKELL